jgi:hypothetical protein
MLMSRRWAMGPLNMYQHCKVPGEEVEKISRRRSWDFLMIGFGPTHSTKMSSCKERLHRDMRSATIAERQRCATSTFMVQQASIAIGLDRKSSQHAGPSRSAKVGPRSEPMDKIASGFA